MRTDRLYAITVYLLNHGKTSASELAKKFEVSIRTIQRDVDSLCKAGIPVVAETGVNGGYYLTDSFKMDAQTATDEEYSYILTALKGFSTAINSPRIDNAIEKISSLTKKKDDSVILDFSVLREMDNNLIQMLQDAIKTRNAVRFGYTNTENIFRIHTVEPIAVIYRWYAWYLLAYSTVKSDYRTYKLVRMNGYYVLPILYGDNFVGRIEVVADKKAKILTVKNIWFEERVKQTKKLLAEIGKCAKKFARFNDCDSII